MLTRKQILEAYMVFGGVPYYWSLLHKGASVAQEIDRLMIDHYTLFYYQQDI